MNYWLISDTHFNHLRLEEWGKRSGLWQESIWNGLEKIPETDTLIHLGDICIGQDIQIHNRLVDIVKCRKVLVKGNHDKRSTNWYYEHGWNFVCDGIEMIYMGHYLHLTHRPARPQGNNTFNIHGHTHGNLHRSEEYVDFYTKEYHIDISPELIGFKPIRLDSLLKNIK